jgi:quinol monooxygenase YgiN
MTDGTVIIDVTFRATPARKADFLASLNDLMTAVLAEPGCVTFRPTAALDDPLTFHLLEIWQDEAAYFAHRKGAPLVRFKAALPSCGQVTAMDRRIGPLQPYEQPPL